MNTWKKQTTMEELEMIENSTVIEYDSNIICTVYRYDNENKRDSAYCAIYDFTTKKQGIEAPIRLVTFCHDGFKDNGHAIEWGMQQLTDLYDDPIELLMNYTNPHEQFTLTEMEKFVSQAIAEGWRCPPDWTPQDFLDVYYDLEPEEDEEE